MSNYSTKDNAELAELLPWYVNGTLDEETMAAIDRACQTDPDLERNLQRALEDQAAAIELADADPVPQSITARFEAQLDREIADSQKVPAATPGLLERLGNWVQDTLLAGSRPRLAFAAVAAAAIILLQSGAIVSLFLTDSQNAQLDLASGKDAAGGAEIVYLVQLNPEAVVSDLTAFLEAQGGNIIDGPLSGGMFRIGFTAAEGVTAETIKSKLDAEKSLFTLVLPAS